jgi:hypothetical protein
MMTYIMAQWILLLSILTWSTVTVAFTTKNGRMTSTWRMPLFLLSTTQQQLPGDLDTEALYAQSTFPIPPNELIQKAKDVIINQGMGLKDNGACLADNFIFRAAFVETNRDEFFAALQAFKLEDSFDLKQQYYGWMVDPLQTNRVLFYNRQEGKHIQSFMGAAPTNQTLILPPQCLHIDFNTDGKVIEFGFYVVDWAQGNTGGLGGAYGIGRPLPFPEGQPYRMSLRRRAFTVVASFLTKLSKK